jgi:hypothetical protein
LAPSSHLAGKEVGGSLGDEAVDLALMAGLELDPWQQLLLREMCRVDPDTRIWNPYTSRYEQKWQAFEVGVMVSRQNGKGSLLEARELAGLFLFGERVIIHSAHQFDTSQEAFDRLMTLIDNTPELRSEVKRAPRSHGEEGIELINGQKIRFRTRTKGGGRGFTADLVILDEAMFLGDTQMKALLPTLSARPNPQVLYTGSAGNRESIQFGRVRKRGLDGLSPSLMWAEWSMQPCGLYCPKDCDEHDDPSTPEAVAKANPALGYRLDWDFVQAEAEAFGGFRSEGFLEERGGVGDWPADGDAWLVIPKESWERRQDDYSEPVGKWALAIAVAPDSKWSAIAMSSANKLGDTHVEITNEGGELLDYRPGIGWVVPRVKRIWDAFKPAFVVVDRSAPEGTLIDELEALGIKVKTYSAVREYNQACGDFKTGVHPTKGETAHVTHIGQAAMRTAVAAADRQQSGDLWRWSTSLSAADITPLRAATGAVWGFKKHIHKKSSTPWAARRRR